jgi:hypothetical protein
MMTTPRSRPASTRPRRPDGVLLFLAVDGPDWAEHIPPAPGDADVTVSLSPAAAAAGHADALEDLGYRPVGTDRRTQPLAVGAGASVQLLIAFALIETYPTWYRALAERAERAYNLAHGPAAAALAPLVQLHTEPLREASG